MSLDLLICGQSMTSLWVCLFLITIVLIPSALSEITLSLSEFECDHWISVGWGTPVDVLQDEGIGGSTTEAESECRLDVLSKSLNVLRLCCSLELSLMFINFANYLI